MSSIVGKRIKEIRESQGISQNKLAKMANVSQSAISSIEGETKSPSIDTIALIAQALGVHVIDLICEKKEELPEEGELKNRVADLCDSLNVTPYELQRILDFAEGIKAARK